MRTATVALPVLATACVGLGVLNWVLVTREIELSPIAPPSVQGETSRSAEVMPQFQLKPLDKLEKTTARPLFTPTRRPAPKAAPVAQQQSPEPTLDPAGIQLVGVIQDDAGGRRALIRWGKEREGAWTTVGEKVNGWQVSEINDAQVVIAAKGRKHALVMR
jgi:hypothetical protein